MKTPCKSCPFQRTTTPGHLGGSPTNVFIGQIHAPFFIPCHCHIDYADPEWKAKATTVPHCAGARIFRANLGVVALPESIAGLPKDTTTVFATVEEFTKHHDGTADHPSVASCVASEMQRAGMRIHLVRNQSA